MTKVLPTLRFQYYPIFWGEIFVRIEKPNLPIEEVFISSSYVPNIFLGAGKSIYEKEMIIIKMCSKQKCLTHRGRTLSHKKPLVGIKTFWEGTIVFEHPAL